MTTRQSSQHHTAGVTLIELMVVIGIVAVVSAVVMFNYSKFTTNVSIRNLAQDIALSIRKAQSYATSVQSLAGGSTSSYPGYGIIFSLATNASNPATPGNKQFILFADVNGDGKYNQGSTCGTPTDGNECLESFSITSSDSIVQLCSDALGGCTSNTGQTVQAMFCRPSPDAAIYVNGAVSSGCAAGATSMDVIVRSAQGLQQTIRLWNTGQISVQ